MGGQKLNCPGCGQRLQIPAPKAMPLTKTILAVDDSCEQPAYRQLSPLVSPSLPVPTPAEEGGTCTFCRKPMPSDAIKCPSCQNWREDPQAH